MWTTWWDYFSLVSSASCSSCFLLCSSFCFLIFYLWAINLCFLSYIDSDGPFSSVVSLVCSDFTYWIWGFDYSFGYSTFWRIGSWKSSSALFDLCSDPFNGGKSDNWEVFADCWLLFSGSSLEAAFLVYTFEWFYSTLGFCWGTY